MAENTASKWWSKDTVAVVTGSCRGIGRAILRQLATEGITVVMTDISGSESMQTSVEALKAELQLRCISSGLASGPDVFWHPVDIRSEKSVAALANWLKKEFGGIDILVNNAAIIDNRGAEIKYEVAKNILDTNFSGTKRITEALLPLMRRTSTAGARIISITSRAGTYERLKNKSSAKAKLSDLDHLSLEILDNLALDYLEDVKTDRLEEAGWTPRSSFNTVYAVSKMLVSAYVHVLASSVLADGSPGAIFVTACCPGAVDTVMMDEESRKKLQGTAFKLKSVQEGADTAVWLALFPKEGYPSGRLFAEREEFPYNLKLPIYNYDD